MAGEGGSGSGWVLAEVGGGESGRVTGDLERAYREMRDREGSRGKWTRPGVTYIAGGLVFKGPVSEPDVLLIQVTNSHSLTPTPNKWSSRRRKRAVTVNGTSRWGAWSRGRSWRRARPGR